MLRLCCDVQNRTQPQQELFRVVEPGAIGRTAIEQRRVGQRGDGPRRPQIAQGAGRVLHVRLELVEGVVEARVPLVDQRRQGLQNPRMRRRRAHPCDDALEQRHVAGDGARIEQREQELGVVDFELGEVVDLANLMAD